MAVWIYAYGKNGLPNRTSEEVLLALNQIAVDGQRILDCIKDVTKDRTSVVTHYIKNRQQIEADFYAKSDAEYQEYLASVNFPALSRAEIVDYLLEEGLAREEKEREHFEATYAQFKSQTLQSQWEKGEQHTYVNRLGSFREYDGLRIWLLNDLVGLSGPAAIFAHYATFQRAIRSDDRTHFHELFKQIMKTFNSDFIGYTHEWSGLDDEDDPDFDLKKLQAQSDWTNNTSRSIHTMSNFYFEKIQ